MTERFTDEVRILMAIEAWGARRATDSVGGRSCRARADDLRPQGP